MTLTGKSEPGDGLHGGDHDRRPGHVALHVLHRGARLEAQPAGVERDALADQGDGWGLAAPAVVENDEAPGASRSRPPRPAGRRTAPRGSWSRPRPATAIPASMATPSDPLGQVGGDFSEGGVFTRSRARLMAWPTISPRRS